MPHTPSGRSRTVPSGSAPRRRRGTVALALLAALLAPVLLTSGTADGSPAHAGLPSRARTSETVTLITGDVVHVRRGADGRRSVSFDPGPDGLVPKAAVSEVGKHLYVVPERAFSLLAERRLDLDLFDVEGLVAAGYDDGSTTTLPVIVDYGRGAAAAREARAASFSAAVATVRVPALGATAYAADKRNAVRFWKSLTAAEDRAGTPTALAEGAVRVDLDGRVSVSLEDSVPQIRAPQAWTAGFDGTGVTVAVLDTGYDPTHPDLAGRVDAAVNFTDDPDVVDGNGHGTHVASTVAGSGAASGGLRKGAAPGARLEIGKVLNDAGSGQDSMVLAGMQWAVASGADVISMSLGGDTSDGTDPLSRAVDELSASSDSLFVIAAGNNGQSGPSTVSSPGAASSALTVGAVDVDDRLADFSSRGPRYGDGAVKPEVVAPGVGVVAARAAGTDPGSVVDDRYASLNGTSMATPHVAGVAAILKQRHPSWTGERLKAVIAGSAVPVDGTGPFETGDGRVDAMAALRQDVFSEPSVDLGFYRWPHDTLPVTHTPLTYTNTSDQPVTLSLTAPAATPGVTLAATTLTVPAGSQAAVDVLLDPTVAGTGTFAGVVQAVPDDGGVPVRTAVSYGLEDERYDVTVEVTPRAGTQEASHLVALIGLDNGEFQQRTLDASPGTRSVTWRVAPGSYSASALSFGLAADEAHESVLAARASVPVARDTTVVLDENTTARYDYATDRPVVDDGSIMIVDWTGKSGEFAGFMLTGKSDRVYAGTDPGSGSVDSSLTWMLTQPEAELATGHGDVVALRPVTGEDQDAWDVDLPELSVRARVVDAGTVDALKVARVRGAVAVVAGSCADLTPAARALDAAGAKAMVVYPGEGAACAGTLPTAGPLLSLQARPYEARRLFSGGDRPARLVTRANPDYVYDLADSWTGRMPDGATLDGSPAGVAALVETVRSLGGTTADGFKAHEMLIGWIPDQGVAAFGLVRPVRLPSTVTHLVSEGPSWERIVDVVDVATGGLAAELAAPAEPVVAGTTRQDTWFGGPVASTVSPYSAVLGWQGQPYRQGDDLWTYAPPFTDDAGHWGPVLFLDEYEGRISVDGEEYLSASDPWRLNGLRIPSGPHRIDYEVDTTRATPFWQRSTRIRTVWGFDSDTTVGDHEVLPLLGVDYDLPLSDLNTAAAGSYRMTLTPTTPPGVRAVAVRRVGLELSWDGGRTWSRQTLSCAPGRHGPAGSSCSVTVSNRRNASASLRVSVEDVAGRTVDQTVIDAYRVR